MDFKYSKEEKLKSRTAIDLLFKKGESVSKYPIRLVYRMESEQNQPIQFGVSVSKRYFKHATDRNYYKRCLRESFRLNKNLLLQAGLPPINGMLMYQSKEKLSFQEIQEKTIRVFEKLIEKQKAANISSES